MGQLESVARARTKWENNEKRARTWWFGTWGNGEDSLHWEASGRFWTPTLTLFGLVFLYEMVLDHVSLLFIFVCFSVCFGDHISVFGFHLDLSGQLHKFSEDAVS